MDLEFFQECEELAQELHELQAEENQGRGVGCIRTLCIYLNRGDLSSARALCLNESDKISSYPRIINFIRLRLSDLFLKNGLEPVLDDPSYLYE